MGARGPIPQREGSLARERSRKGSDEQGVKPGLLRSVNRPIPDEEWHPISRMVWESLITSGQADFFQDSDWAYAYTLCEELSLFKTGSRRSPEMFKALLSGMANLLMTEGDRRRVRVELSAPEPAENSATVAVMDDYRARLSVVPDED